MSIHRLNRMMELHECAEEGRRSRRLEEREELEAKREAELAEWVDGQTNDLVIAVYEKWGMTRKEACAEIQRYLK